MTNTTALARTGTIRTDTNRTTTPHTGTTGPTPNQSRTTLQTFRRAAIGKAIIAYLATGSLLVAGLVYLLFGAIGC
jgi:hypothetical protein